MAIAVRVNETGAEPGPEFSGYPAGGLSRVFRHFVRNGIAPESLLDGTGLSEGLLADPERRIQGWQEYAFARNLLAVGDDPHAGLVAGACCRLGTFGVLGTAAATCETAGDALALFSRYIDLSPAQFHIDMHVARDGCMCIGLRDRFPLGELRSYFLDRDLACMVTVVRDCAGMAGHFRPGISLRSTRTDRRWADACESVLGIRPELGAGADEIRVAPELLATALPLANESQRQLLEQQCRYESWQRRHQAASTLDRVWQVLSAAGERIPSIDETARLLSMSERTLRRRLTGEGTGFQDVVDRFREMRARELLTTSRDAVERIADRLGYSEASAFIHAFKRWTGQTPGNFRAMA